MKKIILITFLVLLLTSCNNIKIDQKQSDVIEQNIEESKKMKSNDFLTWVEIPEEELKIRKEKVENKLKNMENSLNTEEVEELSYPEIIDYSKLNIEKINQNFIEKTIIEESLLIDLDFDSSNKKLEKILNIAKNLADLWKINIFELHCKEIKRFNEKELNTLKNMKLKTLILEDICWFSKEKFSWTWYDKQKVIDFLKQAKNIEELEIWRVNMDLFKKENWEIKFYSWQ